MYECGLCGKTVVRIDGKLLRTCEHSDAVVVAPLSAVLYGEAHVNMGIPEAVALMDTTPASGE